MLKGLIEQASAQGRIRDAVLAAKRYWRLDPEDEDRAAVLLRLLLDCEDRARAQEFAARVEAQLSEGGARVSKQIQAMLDELRVLPESLPSPLAPPAPLRLRMPKPNPSIRPRRLGPAVRR